ncbi:hypothetical protein Lalb_Chr13g0294981 [Lupinus albus]|uniref:Uncharacterized protein n=1 Tax=Lupinus albus TaxID=3870 RepID=A0A6A4PII8_LUPAL|nr:hypothetical protein Lalb_Chr13g0294981 [Lupinus albus]
MDMGQFYTRCIRRHILTPSLPFHSTKTQKDLYALIFNLNNFLLISKLCCFFLSWGKCDSSRDLYLLIFSVHQFAFLIGGVQGFLYLQLLQRSGDALPASELITGNKGEALFCLFRGLKGPIASVALVVGFAVFAVVQWIFK